MMVTIDRAGRVVIPKELRDRLDLQPDSALELSAEGDAIVIRRAHRAGRRVVEVDGWPVLEPVEGVTTTDLDVQRWRDADQR
jgi:AbrB family looped-hinge helix DNA binding protein